MRTGCMYMRMVCDHVYVHCIHAYRSLCMCVDACACKSCVLCSCSVFQNSSEGKQSQKEWSQQLFCQILEQHGLCPVLCTALTSPRSRPPERCRASSWSRASSTLPTCSWPFPHLGFWLWSWGRGTCPSQAVGVGSGCPFHPQPVTLSTPCTSSASSLRSSGSSSSATQERAPNQF